MKPLLRYDLPDVKHERSKSLESLNESVHSGKEEESKEKSGARSNH